MSTYITAYTYVGKTYSLTLCDINQHDLFCKYWFWNMYNPVSMKSNICEKPGPD